MSANITESIIVIVIMPAVLIDTICSAGYRSADITYIVIIIGSFMVAPIVTPSGA